MEVEALKNDFQLIAAGYNSNSSLDYEFINLEYKRNPIKIDFHVNYPSLIRKLISFVIKLIYYPTFYKIKHEEKFKYNYQFNSLKKVKHDLLIVHHIWNLELAVKLARIHNSKIIFNAHEYYPLEFDNDEQWMKTWHIKYTEMGKNYFHELNDCWCVGEIISKKYLSEFGLKSKVIPNTKPFVDILPSQVMANGKIELVHHGAAIPSRKIELMIELMDHLTDDYQLTLILMPAGDLNYFEQLKAKADSHPRVQLLDPLPIYQISTSLNKFDVGLYILPHSNFNEKNALPNKFFEFVQARLMIAIGPSPEMQNIVSKHDLGFVADDFSPQSMANLLLQLNKEKITYYKNQCHKHALELSDSVTKQEMLNSVKQLI